MTTSQSLSALLGKMWTQGARPESTTISVCELYVDIRILGLQIGANSVDQSLHGFKCRSVQIPALCGLAEISETQLAANPTLRSGNADGETCHVFKLLFVSESPHPSTIEVQAEKLVTLNEALEKDWLRSFIAK